MAKTNKKRPFFLIFEPEVRTVDGIKALLIGHGYQYQIVDSAESVLNEALRDDVMGIILGDRLPDITPPLLIQRIQDINRTYPIPVLLLTRSSFAGSIQVKMPTPFWLLKPITETGLLKQIAEMKKVVLKK